MTGTDGTLVLAPEGTTTGGTLADVETMTTLTKGQVRAVPGNDMPAQRAFVYQVFGLAA
jgi:hypothetical protein